MIEQILKPNIQHFSIIALLSLDYIRNLINLCLSFSPTPPPDLVPQSMQVFLRGIPVRSISSLRGKQDWCLRSLPVVVLLEMTG